MSRMLVWVALVVGVSATAWAADGKDVFMENSCNRCHGVEAHDIAATVKSERMRGPDLSEIGKEHDADWIVGVVAKEIEPDGKAHRAAFKGSDEDLRTVAEWLASLDGTH